MALRSVLNYNGGGKISVQPQKFMYYACKSIVRNKYAYQVGLIANLNIRNNLCEIV